MSWQMLLMGRFRMSNVHVVLALLSVVDIHLDIDTILVGRESKSRLSRRQSFVMVPESLDERVQNSDLGLSAHPILQSQLPNYLFYT
jgi:hypothetical protein